MKLIISNIEQLLKVVKVKASTPFAVFEPFIESASDLFLRRYLGDALVDLLQQDVIPERAELLLPLVQKALGPLALWIGNAELSVRVGDAGFTVEKQEDKFLPASDKKIAKVEESLELRGFQYLDLVLEFLEKNAALFPEFTESKCFSLRSGNYISSAAVFNELVDIDMSRLTFESFRPLMSMIEERFVLELLGKDLDARLRSKLNVDQSWAEKDLIAAVRKFVASKTAELHTSVAAKRNRSLSDKFEFQPLIRPVYSDLKDEGNFFAKMADFYFDKMKLILSVNASEFGVSDAPAPFVFNNEDRKLFNSLG